MLSAPNGRERTRWEHARTEAMVRKARFAMTLPTQPRAAQNNDSQLSQKARDGTAPHQPVVPRDPVGQVEGRFSRVYVTALKEAGGVCSAPPQPLLSCVSLIGSVSNLGQV